jgi:uncharacterized protein YbjQ (UPF0145 family)
MKIRDFFLTESNSVSFDYRPIGSLSVSISSGLYDPAEESGRTSSYRKFRNATANDTVNALYEKARRYKADGIINLGFRYYRKKNGQTVRISATGMAIKRK